MPGIAPHVRHFLLCEDARTTPRSPKKINIYGLLLRIRIRASQRLPIRHSFTAFLLMTGGRGSGTGQIQVLQADTGTAVFVGNPLVFEFGSDPLEITSAIVRIPSCLFPERGLYIVEFRYNGELLETESLTVE